MIWAAGILILTGQVYAPGRLFAFLAAGLLLCIVAGRAWVRGKRWPALAVFIMILGAGAVAWRSARAIQALRTARRGPPPLVDGAWSGSAEGLRGPIRVRVEVSRGRLTYVRIVSCADSPSLAAQTLEETRQRILEESSPRIRTAPGARTSAAALCRAVEDALWSAKGPPLGLVDSLLVRLVSNDPRPTTFGALVAILVALAGGKFLLGLDQDLDRELEG